MDKLIEAITKSKSKITFGLQPHHIEAIEKEIERFGDREFAAKYSRYLWDKLGKELAWEPFTLCLYYFEYLEESSAAGEKFKVSNANEPMEHKTEACINPLVSNSAPPQSLFEGLMDADLGRCD